MSERVKYDSQKELELAWLEVDKLPSVEVTDVTIHVIARNHRPTSSKQVWTAFEENPGLMFKQGQEGRLLIDQMVSVVEQHIWEQLVIKFQEKLQREQMETMRPKLEIAPAGLVDK